jgi:SAM-dependent methyltransferase
MGLRQRLMARTYDRLMAGYERHAGPRRAALLGDLAGRVVELGPGTGVNLQHLPAQVEWHGVEPSEPMRAQLRRRWAEQHGPAATDAEPRFVDLADGRIDLADGFADVVVATLVLCSVPDQAATLAEVRRVLKPGGRFVFLEHVGAPTGTWTRRLQALATPLWRHLADGCCLNRDTGAAIEAAGFSTVGLEPYRVPQGAAPGWVAHHVAGVATR